MKNNYPCNIIILYDLPCFLRLREADLYYRLEVGAQSRTNLETVALFFPAVSAEDAWLMFLGKRASQAIERAHLKYSSVHTHQKEKPGTGEMAWWLRALDTPPEDPGSVPSIPVVIYGHL